MRASGAPPRSRAAPEGAAPDTAAPARRTAAAAIRTSPSVGATSSAPSSGRPFCWVQKPCVSPFGSRQVAVSVCRGWILKRGPTVHPGDRGAPPARRSRALGRAAGSGRATRAAGPRRPPRRRPPGCRPPARGACSRASGRRSPARARRGTRSGRAASVPHLFRTLAPVGVIGRPAGGSHPGEHTRTRSRITPGKETILAVKPGSRGRRITVWTPVVLGGVVVLVGSLTLWARRQLLDTDTWVKSSNKMLQDDEVRQAVSTYAVEQLFANVDVEAALQARLGDQGDALAAPASAALYEAALRTTDAVLQTPQAQQVWEEL